MRSGAAAMRRRTMLGEQLGRELVAGRDHDLLLNAGLIGEDDVAARAVAKQADHGWMRTAEHANDLALGAVCAAAVLAAADAGHDVIAVQRVTEMIGRY